MVRSIANYSLSSNENTKIQNKSITTKEAEQTKQFEAAYSFGFTEAITIQLPVT